MGKLTIDEVIGHCERTVERFEKQTSRAALEKRPLEEIFIKEYWEHRQVAEWLKELQAFKDKQEQGLLVELPVPLGSTVYEIFYLYKRGTLIEEREMTLKYYADNQHRFGNRVFLTRSEAEEALAKMGGKA